MSNCHTPDALGLRRRRGAVLLAVLVVLIVSSLLIGAMLRTSRQEHRLLRSGQARLQTIELAQAGLERAAAQLASNPNYTTETWKVTADELHGRHAAAIHIDVQEVSQRQQRRLVRVEVNYPPTGPDRVQHRQEAFIDLPEKDTP